MMFHLLENIFRRKKFPFSRKMPKKHHSEKIHRKRGHSTRKRDRIVVNAPVIVTEDSSSSSSSREVIRGSTLNSWINDPWNSRFRCNTCGFGVDRCSCNNNGNVNVKIKEKVTITEKCSKCHHSWEKCKCRTTIIGSCHKCRKSWKDCRCNWGDRGPFINFNSGVCFQCGSAWDYCNCGFRETFCFRCGFLRINCVCTTIVAGPNVISSCNSVLYGAGYNYFYTPWGLGNDYFERPCFDGCVCDRCRHHNHKKCHKCNFYPCRCVSRGPCGMGFRGVILD